MKDSPLRIGISQCLLGDHVRYDGGHKRDSFLAGTLGRYVEWVPVCPEVEIGLGTPREAMRLVGHARAPRLVTIQTKVDHTHGMEQFSRRRIRELEQMNLSGYVFKSNSPSCGTRRVRLYTHDGKPNGSAVGLFARAVMAGFPLLPVEEEGRLNDPAIRENFIERVCCYRRWCDLLQGRITRAAITNFHQAHRYVVLAHSLAHAHALDRLIAKAVQHTPTKLASRYGFQFMQALKIRPTVRKHVNVLAQIVGCVKSRLSDDEKNELDQAINDYRNGLTPLMAPVTLIKHYVAAYHVTCLRDQVYLDADGSRSRRRQKLNPVRVLAFTR